MPRLAFTHNGIRYSEIERLTKGDCTCYRDGTKPCLECGEPVAPPHYIVWQAETGDGQQLCLARGEVFMTLVVLGD